MKFSRLILMVLLLASCGRAKDGMQDMITATMEKAIEKNIGSTVDLGNAEVFRENASSISFSVGERTYLEKSQKLNALAVFMMENDGLAISFQMANEQGASLVAMVTHIPENFSLPIIGEFNMSNSYDGENPIATLMYMETSEDGLMMTPMPFEGTLTITKLSEDEMLFVVDARGGEAIDADSPSNWKTIQVKGALTSPIVHSIGIDKNDVLQ